MHLWCDFRAAVPVFDTVELQRLQAVINARLPQWSTRLRVTHDEESPNCVFVGGVGRLTDGVWQATPATGGFGSAVMMGQYDNLMIFLHYVRGTLPPELNSITVEIYDATTVEGLSVSAWAREFIESITLQLSMRYGNCRQDDEFRHKNMIDDETGARAIGVDVRQAIPGLYWLNYFGAEQVELIGRDRLLTAPAYEVKPVGDGVLLALDASADAWSSPTYAERERAVIEHLGAQYFFSRYQPNRKTIAPEFRAPSNP